MNKIVTDGVLLIPPKFAAGLDVWSSQDGTPGSDTYANNLNAAFVPADSDFGGCLELVKTEPVQALRYIGETPLLPECYLQVRVKVKAVSGPFPAVRIAAWAGGIGGDMEPGLVSFDYGPATGPSPTSITSRLQAGESFHFVVLPVGLAKTEIAAGRLVGEALPVFASTVAFCVAAGAERPDLSTEAGLWQALITAPSIAVSAAGSGKFFRDVLVPKSGHESVLDGKVTTFTDRPVGTAVAEGLAALGFQQKAELLEADGIEVIDDLAP